MTKKLTIDEALTEAQAARDQYGEVLSPVEDFMLTAKCEALAKEIEFTPEIWKTMREVLAIRMQEFYEEKGRTEGWSLERTAEEFLKTFERKN